MHLLETRLTIEIHICFLRVPLPKTGLEKISLLLDEKSHDLGTQQESCKKMVYLRLFWVKKPRHSVFFSTKKGIPLS